eukprot:g2018.t1
MGIKGLTSFIQRTYGDDKSASVLPAGSTLLVDGSCLAFALQDPGLLLDHDYARYAAAVRDFVGKCRACGLRLHVFLDGPVRRMKRETSLKRREQADSARHGLRLYTLDGHLGDELPAPPLCVAEMKAELESLARTKGSNVRVEHCAEEADQALAIACSSGRYGVGGRSCFVVGQDSDFFAFSGCHYLPIDTLQLPQLQPGQAPHLQQARGVVWSREELAARMGVRPCALVELCILMGNDYTGPFDRRFFDGVAEEADGGAAAGVGAPAAVGGGVLGSHASAERQLEWVAAQDAFARVSAGNFRLATDDPHLALATSFSRALYECEPLDSFPVDAPGTASSVASASARVVTEELDTSSAWNLDWFDGKSFHCFVRQAIAGESKAQESKAQKQKSKTKKSRTQGNESAARRKQGAGASSCDSLPIDAHRTTIMEHVANHRVTVITGETGCGKSSRVPQFLLESDPNARLMVAQPRRIAASGLAKRMRSTCGAQFGLRLGHGMRDENSKTRVWYVTTGYLLLYLAHHPDEFARHTHLVVDEVHERSVDTDILCFLARELLQKHPTIRLVLMSATLCSELYQEYFGVDGEPIFVGARRFPVTTLYLGDLAKGVKNANGRAVRVDGGKATRLCEACFKDGRVIEPGARVPQAQHAIALELLRQIATDGGSALVFVSGMADIVELTEAIDDVRGATRLVVMPIHSDIPFDEQLAAFDDVEGGTFKVILATNAAESSVTLPALDHVICLGCHKQMEYMENSHRQLLKVGWITQSSATQRAGRTGRLRPGTVYRLYPQELHDAQPRFPRSEILRTPLDNTVLRLRKTIDHIPVSEMLANTLEPPETKSVTRSFHSLFDLDMLSEPTDEGALTSTGELAAALPIDLRLSRMISVAAQLELLPEAITVCTALTLPKEPFRIASPLIHKDPNEYNQIVADVTVARNFFDGGSYSEPIMLARLLRGWRVAKAAPIKGGKSRRRGGSSCTKRASDEKSPPKRSLGDFMGGETPEAKRAGASQDDESAPAAQHPAPLAGATPETDIEGNSENARSFARRHTLAWARMQQFDSMQRHLCTKIASHFGVEAADLELHHNITTPRSLNLVRTLLLWAFSDQMVQCLPMDESKLALMKSLTRADEIDERHGGSSNEGGGDSRGKARADMLARIATLELENTQLRGEQHTAAAAAQSFAQEDRGGDGCDGGGAKEEPFALAHFDVRLGNLPPGVTPSDIANLIPNSAPIEREVMEQTSSIHYQAKGVSLGHIHARVLAVQQLLGVTAAWLISGRADVGDDGSEAVPSIHLWLRAEEAQGVLKSLGEIFMWDECHDLTQFGLFEFHARATKARLRCMKASVKICRAAFTLKFPPDVERSRLADLDCYGCQPDAGQLMALFGDDASWKDALHIGTESVFAVAASLVFAQSGVRRLGGRRGNVWCLQLCTCVASQRNGAVARHEGKAQA